MGTLIKIRKINSADFQYSFKKVNDGWQAGPGTIFTKKSILNKPKPQ